MPRIKDLPPEEAERIALQKQARKTFAAWFGPFFEEGGLMKAEYDSYVSSSGVRAIKRRVFLGNDDSTLMLLQSIFGGHIRSQKWGFFGDEAVDFALTISDFCPSRQADITALENKVVITGTADHRKSKIIIRPPGVIEQYRELLKNDFFMAGVVDRLRHSKGKINVFTLETTNKPLLEAVGELFNRKPYEFAEAGMELPFETRRGVSRRTIDITYRLDLLPKTGAELLSKTANFSPIRRLHS